MSVDDLPTDNPQEEIVRTVSGVFLGMVENNENKFGHSYDWMSDYMCKLFFETIKNKQGGVFALLRKLSSVDGTIGGKLFELHLEEYLPGKRCLIARKSDDNPFKYVLKIPSPGCDYCYCCF